MLPGSAESVSFFSSSPGLTKASPGGGVVPESREGGSTLGTVNSSS